MRWLWLACRLAQDLWDDELWHVLATRGVRVARDTGALNLLPNVANYLAALNVHSGTSRAAAALIDEVDAITQATGTPAAEVLGGHAGRGRGDEAEALELIESALRKATARGEGSALGVIGGLPRCCTTATATTARRSRPRSEACEHEDVRRTAGPSSS